MKRILTMIALAVLSVGLLGSCSKNIEERLDKTEAGVADIKAAIGQYENLTGDITSVIETLRAEVGTRPASEQKTIWDCINALQNQKGTFEAAIAALQELVGDDAVSVQIDDAVAELISEYNLDTLAAEIQAIRDKLNEKSGISALADEVSQLQKKAESLALVLSKIGAYEDMIQSVRINPTYADGSVKADDGIVSFTFTVTPAEALNGVTNLAKCLKLYADKVEVLTKAGAFSEIPVTKAEIIDKAKGEVSVEADVTKFLPEEKTEALSIALNVRTGVSNYTTDFVKVTLPAPPIPEELFGNWICPSYRNWTMSLSAGSEGDVGVKMEHFDIELEIWVSPSPLWAPEAIWDGEAKTLTVAKGTSTGFSSSKGEIVWEGIMDNNVADIVFKVDLSDYTLSLAVDSYRSWNGQTLYSGYESPLVFYKEGHLPE